MPEIRKSHDRISIDDSKYGKTGVKVLQIVRKGAVHSIKELEVSTRLTLATDKDYKVGDNSDIIATDSQKNTVYVLAKKHGVKTCEDFGILLCKHYISTYSHVTKAYAHVEELQWDRISYSKNPTARSHNHAFVHTPVCTRFTDVSLSRDEKYPIVESGVKDLRVLKTTQSAFVNFVDDAYRTLGDFKDRIFSTIIDCSWAYHPNSKPDYDKAWEIVKLRILENFGGDLDEGIFSPSVQNTIYLTAKDILGKIEDVDWVQMELPNKHYFVVDFEPFKSIVKDEGEPTIFLPTDKPHGSIYAKIDRKMNKL